MTDGTPPTSAAPRVLGKSAAAGGRAGAAVVADALDRIATSVRVPLAPRP